MTRVALVMMVSLAACAGPTSSDSTFPIRPSTGATHHAFSADAAPEPMTVDGKWYCFEVSGAQLKSDDVRSMCQRTRERCERAHTFADDLGLNPTECKGRETAVCHPVKFPERSWSELCYITGEDCERSRGHVPEGSETKPCAIEKNDAPPKGGKSAIPPRMPW